MLGLREIVAQLSGISLMNSECGMGSAEFGHAPPFIVKYPRHPNSQFPIPNEEGCMPGDADLKARTKSLFRIPNPN